VANDFEIFDHSKLTTNHFSDVAMGAFFPRDQVGEFKGENGGQAHDLKIRPQYQRYRLHGTSECDAGPGAWPQWSL